MSELLVSGNSTPMKFIVKVNGQVRSAPLPQTLAEAAIQNLPENERAIAQLVAVTESGQELLLG